MATSREAQGWQISVIIFALLTVILAITTYVFYSQSETAVKDMKAAQETAKTAQQNEKKLFYRMTAYKYVLGAGGITMGEVDAARQSAGQEDEEVKGLLDKFAKDMQMFGSEVGAEGAKNYVTLPEYLLAVITKQNEKVVDTNAREKKLLDEKDSFQANEKKLTETAVSVQTVAQNDLASEKVKFDEARTAVTTKMTSLETQLAGKDKTIKDITEKAVKERELLEKQVLQYQQLSDGLRTQVSSFREASQFEIPDGVVTWVNQQQRIAWINLGTADGLNRQTTFSVYNYDQAGVSSAKPKGRIEVIKVTGPHSAECRILDDQVANPIMPKDLIHSPAWSPGQEIHFALVGFMDIDEDGQSDRETIKRILSLNGAIVDAELEDDGTATGKLSINTRYLIQGDKPNEKTGAKVLAEYNNMLTEVQRYNVEVISVQEFLAMMGWKPEEKKIDYRGAKDLTGFRQRQPAAPGAPVGPAAGGTTNPAPLTPAPPAAGLAPMADPAPAADPFDPFK